MPRLYDSRWQRIRPVILDRDGHVCQLRLEGCTHDATEVDHIVPARVDPLRRLDPSNLRASCKQCNIARRNGVVLRGNRPSREWF